MYVAKKMGHVSAEDASRLSLEGVEKFFGGDAFGRELDHQLPAADGDVFLIERIESLLAILAHGDEVCLAQDGEVMRNGGLGDIQLFNDLADGERIAAADVHDLLTGFV